MAPMPDGARGVIDDAPFMLFKKSLKVPRLAAVVSNFTGGGCDGAGGELNKLIEMLTGVPAKPIVSKKEGGLVGAVDEFLASVS